MEFSGSNVHVLSRAGTSVVFDTSGDGVPRIVHWGDALGADPVRAAREIVATAVPAVMNSAPDAPRVFSLLPTEAEGWSGSPGLAGHAGGRATTPRLTLRSVDGDDAAVTFTLVDPGIRLTITLRYAMDRHGVLEASGVIERDAAAPAEPYDLASLLLLVPIPARADEILDFTGRWSRERQPQRTPVRDGTHRRTTRRGRPGHDASFVTVVGAEGFGFRHGEVWAAHVAWSGDQESLVERLPEGAGALTSALGGGELLRAGEVRLAPGERYESPAVVFAWSNRGLDGLSERLHGHVRDFAGHPATPRPLVLNTWEAVYFDHDPARLTELARTAASVGVERFVLDDGWFQGRRDDHSSLGDWQVDGEVWPEGLQAISSVVHGLGMQFGLWFEPEMVSPDSNLAREHPDWILGPRELPLTWRHQQVLDLANPDAYAYILESMSALIAEVGIDFVKWDHNRDLLEAARDGAPMVHEQTVALYALLDELLRRHPALEIETCASGGGRIDLGMLRRTHRVWTSDTNDPIERQRIQRWTGLLVPPELIGSHLGPAESHTTHRVSSLAFGMATALFGHSGIEWDLAGCSAAELDEIRRWTALYRDTRDLLATGITVRADLDADRMLHGVVSPDRARALFAWVALGTTPIAHSSRVQLPGLDPSFDYRVAVSGDASRHEVADPAWMLAGGEVVLSGAVLSGAGLPLPVLNPGQALLLHLERVG